jgi:hypothetical protein
MGIDRWLVVGLTPLVAAGLAFGAVERGERSREDAQRFTAAGEVVLEDRQPTPGGGNPFLGRPDDDAGVVNDPLGAIRIVEEPGSMMLRWERLKTYDYQPGLANLPEEIRALDGKTVTMAGFLLPLYEFEDIHEFALVGNHWSCCFGQPPTLNGVVTVKLAASAPGLPNTAEPIRVVGTFRAKETKESGYVISIFEIEATKVSILRY